MKKNLFKFSHFTPLAECKGFIVKNGNSDLGSILAPICISLCANTLEKKKKKKKEV